MQLENSRASLNHRTIAERTALLQPMPDLQADGALVLSRTRVEATQDPPELEVDEPAESADSQVVIHGELESENIQSIETDIDDDPSYDTAVAVRIDVLSLQRKVLKIAANALRPSLHGSAGESALQRMLAIREDQTNSTSQLAIRKSPLILEDPLHGEWALPFKTCKTIAVSLPYVRPLNRRSTN